MRKLGAAQVMIAQREVWSLWPAGGKADAALLQLKSEETGLRLHSRQQKAESPLTLWRQPVTEPVGPGLRLAPAWAGPDNLVIDALTAFGGGDHASTRLDLEFICRICREPLPRDAWLADVASGIRQEAQEDLAAFMADLGLRVRHSRHSEGWSGLALQKDAA